MQEALQRVCHINVHQGKLAAWSRAEQPCPDDLRGFGAEVWRASGPVEQRGIKVLGTPVGTREYIEQHCADLSGESAKLPSLLLKLPSLQSSGCCCISALSHE